MLDYLTLTPLDWDLRVKWRGLLFGKHGSVEAALSAAVAEAKPVIDPDEKERLAYYEKHGAPLVLRAYLGLRLHPKKYLGDAIKLFHGLDMQHADNALVALAQCGSAMNMMMNPDVFLGYVSERYRILVAGEGGPIAQVSPQYEADPVFVRALAWRTDFEMLEGAVYSSDEVRSIATGLDAVNPSDYPRGDLSPLFDYIEYVLDQDFLSRGYSLNDQFLGTFSQLKAFYDDAGSNGFGIGVRPPADR